MPVEAASEVRVTSRCWRSCLSRGPTWSRTSAISVVVSSTLRSFASFPETATRVDGTGTVPHAAGHGGDDVVVVGGGAAGLSAALVLSRARRRVLVVDAGAPRNAAAAHMHGFLSRDGLPPSELLATGGKEVARYGSTLVADAVVD